MNYPYGQGFPGQPNFPQQPANQPPVYQALGYGPTPGYPNAYPPIPPKGPRSAAAKFAGFLAFLGGLIGAGGGALAIIVQIFSHDSNPAGYLAALWAFTCGSILLVGAVSLWRRKMLGRRLILVGCGAVMATYLVLLIMSMLNSDEGWVEILWSLLAGALPPLLTAFLTTRPSTTAWIQAKQTPVPAPSPAQYFPPNPPQPHWP